MRVLSGLAAAAVISVASISALAEPLTDADHEGKFYDVARTALAEHGAPADDAVYAHLFHAATKRALAVTLATPDDSAYERDFYTAAMTALRAHDPKEQLAQAAK